MKRHITLLWWWSSSSYDTEDEMLWWARHVSLPVTYTYKERSELGHRYIEIKLGYDCCCNTIMIAILALGWYSRINILVGRSPIEPQRNLPLPICGIHDTYNPPPPPVLSQNCHISAIAWNARFTNTNTPTYSNTRLNIGTCSKSGSNRSIVAVVAAQNSSRWGCPYVT